MNDLSLVAPTQTLAERFEQLGGYAQIARLIAKGSDDETLANNRDLEVAQIQAIVVKICRLVGVRGTNYAERRAALVVLAQQYYKV